MEGDLFRTASVFGTHNEDTSKRKKLGAAELQRRANRTAGGKSWRAAHRKVVGVARLASEVRSAEPAAGEQQPSLPGSVGGQPSPGDNQEKKTAHEATRAKLEQRAEERRLKRLAMTGGEEL